MNHVKIHPAPSLFVIPTSSSSSSLLDTSHLPTLMDHAPLLSLSPPSSPTLLPNFPTSPLLMPPMTLPVPISTLVSMLSLVDFSTSCLNSTPVTLPSDDLHLPIALRKGKRSCTLHPISHFISYGNFHPTYHAFSLSLTTELIPKSHLEAIKLPHWKVSMDLEYEALVKRRTCVLVPRLANTSVITCRWVFTLKYNPDRMSHRHKARLVAYEFSQTYGIDYKESFSPIIHLNSTRLIISLAMNQGWSLHQLDVSNAFL